MLCTDGTEIRSEKHYRKNGRKPFVLREIVPPYSLATARLPLISKRYKSKLGQIGASRSQNGYSSSPPRDQPPTLRPSLDWPHRASSRTPCISTPIFDTNDVAFDGSVTVDWPPPEIASPTRSCTISMATAPSASAMPAATYSPGITPVAFRHSRCKRRSPDEQASRGRSDRPVASSD